MLEEMGLNFKVEVRSTDEQYPPTLSAQNIAVFLAELKANQFSARELKRKEIVITADTIVCCDQEILGKPKGNKEAFKMISALSGRSHEVITGVCLKSKIKTKSSYAITEVHFKKLTSKEIHYYIENFKPFDKAGAYGIQEWIGFIGVEKITGSYNNVVGLPSKLLYQELLNFIS